jgi:hypothetical protein
MMERRIFIERLLSALTIGGLLFVSGCGKGDHSLKFGNQEKLWELTTGQGKLEEPVVPPYSKGTAALYRDASMGKADPSFIPRVSGG